MAALIGFEPMMMESESTALPLGYRAISISIVIYFKEKGNIISKL